MTEYKHHYKPPEHVVADSDESDESNQKAGVVWIFVTLVIVTINVMLKYAEAEPRYVHSASELSGYVFGGAILLPLIVVGLFQLGRSFRNSRSRMKVFFWTSMLGVLTTSGNYVQSVNGM